MQGQRGFGIGLGFRVWEFGDLGFRVWEVGKSGFRVQDKASSR